MTDKRPIFMGRARDLAVGDVIVYDCEQHHAACSVPADRHTGMPGEGHVVHELAITDVETHGDGTTVIYVSETGEQGDYRWAEWVIVRVFADTPARGPRMPQMPDTSTQAVRIGVPLTADPEMLAVLLARSAATLTDLTPAEVLAECAHQLRWDHGPTSPLPQAPSGRIVWARGQVHRLLPGLADAARARPDEGSSAECVDSGRDVAYLLAEVQRLRGMLAAAQREARTHKAAAADLASQVTLARREGATDAFEWVAVKAAFAASTDELLSAIKARLAEVAS